MLEKLKARFLHSETVFFAELHIFLGVLLAVADTLDPTLFQVDIPPKLWPLFLLAWGVVLKYLRMRNDPTLGQPAQPNTTPGQ